MLGRLEGKVAVVTGGASGIGAATVERLVSDGARVVIADLQDGPGTELATRLGSSARFIHTDVAREDDVRAAVAEATTTWGRLDVMFNNAGIGGVTGPLDQVSEAEYDATMDVLLKSVFFGIKHASPVMKRQQSGSIVSTASVCAFEAGIGTHLYSVAKAAIVMLTKTMAIELGEWGVRVNCVCPGYIATPLASGGTITDLGAERVGRKVERTRQRTADSQAIARSGEAEDVAALVAFLASDDSGWITGTAQLVDGGLMAGRPWRKQPSYLTERKDSAPG
jgi:short-subunit dehydrogenase